MEYVFLYTLAGCIDVVCQSVVRLPDCDTAVLTVHVVGSVVVYIDGVLNLCNDISCVNSLPVERLVIC
jgi:hypothetical protein